MIGNLFIFVVEEKGVGSMNLNIRLSIAEIKLKL